MNLRDILRGIFGRPVPITPLPVDNQAPPNIGAVLDGHNKLRVNRGLSVLVLVSDLSERAHDHSVEMSRNMRLDHDAFKGRVPNRAMDAAENVLYNRDTDSRVIVNQWKESSGHYKNMIGDFNQIGIGWALGNDGNYYWTAMFIKAL